MDALLRAPRPPAGIWVFFMRKTLILVTVLLIGLTGCQKNKASRDRQMHRPPTTTNRYPNRPLPPHLHQPAPRQSAAPAPGGAWYPKSAKISDRWTQIIVHHSATSVGGAKSFDRAHRAKGWEELGYHFVIGNGTETPDGAIEIGSRWNTQKHGAHCKTPGNTANLQGIGICLVGDFTRTRPTPAQLASLERLTKFLSWACRIPPERITTHRDVTGKTACPGQNFSIAGLRRAVQSPAAASSMR
jgi:hypothetical protein